MLQRASSESGGGGGGTGIATGEFDITGTAQTKTIQTGISNLTGFVVVADVLTNYPNSGQSVTYWNSCYPTMYEFKGIGTYSGGLTDVGQLNGYSSIGIMDVSDVANGNIGISSSSGTYGTAVTNGHYRWFAW